MAMRVYLERSSTGLWSALLITHNRDIPLRGYISRKMAEHAAAAISLHVFGRVPYFMEG